MAITTLDGALAGMRPPVPLIKTGSAMAAAGAMRAHSLWYTAGNPGASVAPTIGINGEAVTPALASPANVVGGRIPRTNPVAGKDGYLGRLAMQASAAGTLWLVDRLWHNSGLSVTATTAQAISPAGLPSRDLNAAALGHGVMAGIEWSATGGAGTPAVTLTYTNQDGTAGQSATLTGVTTPPAGTFEIFALAAGDTGIRAPTSFIQNATRTSGTMHLVLFRLLAQLEITAANIGNAIDILTGGRPEIYDDSVLQLLWIQSGTTGTNFVGSFVETQG